MSAIPAQPALREFVRPVLRHRWLFVLTILAAIGAAAAYSLSQPRVYTATSSIGFQDDNSGLGIVGVATPPTRTAAQIASAGAQVVRSSVVLTRVKSMVGTQATDDQVLHDVSTEVDATSSLVTITATADHANEAAALANAFARVSADVTNENSRKNYADQADALRSRKPKGKSASAEALSLYNVQLSRLRSLSLISAPSSVVDVARTPGSPSSPKPLRDGVLAAFLGFVLALGLVFARDSLDRRLYSSGDIEEEMQLPLIGHVRNTALGRHPRQTGKRALSDIDWEQFRIMRRNLDFLHGELPPRTVVVTSSVPEEGKTTVALNLALATAAAGRRTLLIECDLRRPMLAARLTELASSPGVTDVASGAATASDVIQTLSPDDDPDAAVLDAAPLSCIVAGTATRYPVEVLDSDTFRKLLRDATVDYETVILDTPPMLPVVDARELLPLVDAVVVCVRSERTTRDQARSGRSQLDQIPERTMALVVTGTTRAEERAYGYYDYYAAKA